MYWTSGVFVKDGAPGRHCLLWTIAVLLISILPCGNSSVTLLETIPHDQETLNERMDEQIVHIFATINHIDIINSLIGTDERERKLMQKLLPQRTVRWFNTPPAALCAFAQHDLDSECYSEPQRQEQRGEGYIIYDDLSTINGYECLFDPTGTYVVVNDQSRFTERFGRVQVLEALQRIWMKRGTYRVYVWVQDTLYGYDPFQPLDTVSEYGTLVELGAGAMLPTVPPNNLAGYPVRIEVFRSVYSNPVVSDSKPLNIPTYSGPDVTARDVFCRVLNATVVQVPADRELFGDRLPNGSFSGALGRLVRREVDIVFTGFFIKDYATRDIDFTAGLYSDAVCCLVKKASRIPEALLPLYIFPGDIWALLCMIGLCCSSVWCLLRWCVRQMQQPVASLWSRHHRLAVLFNLSRTVRMGGPGRQALQLYIDTFILLVSAPYQRFTRSGVERLFLTGLLLVSLIFVSLYQSGLAAVFVNPVYYPDIGTLQQLDESRMVIPVKYRGFLDDVFAVNYSRLMDSLRARMQHLPLKESMLARVARLGTIATVTRKTTLALDNAIYMTTRQLHMIPECPRTYNLAYVMPHRSVFGEQFNKVLLRMVGGGLIDHWIDEARYGWTLKDWRVVQAMMESSFKVLTVLDMQFPFYVLMIGLALSIGTIAAELVHFHRTHRPST